MGEENKIVLPCSIPGCDARIFAGETECRNGHPALPEQIEELEIREVMRKVDQPHKKTGQRASG